MKNDQDKVGVIHEIGDLGLGFDELSDEDQAKLDESKISKSKEE